MLLWTATVTGFASNMGNIETPIANVAIAYDDPTTDSTFILIFNQILYIKDLDHNLLSLFQLRVNSIVVNDIPLMTMSCSQPLNTIPPNSHSIITSTPNVVIPLRLNGIMSYFETRKPSKYELDNPDLYPQIIMTYDSPVWDSV
jgi:hypothetical protein